MPIFQDQCSHRGDDDTRSEIEVNAAEFTLIIPARLHNGNCSLFLLIESALQAVI